MRTAWDEEYLVADDRTLDECEEIAAELLNAGLVGNDD
jgi:hypothetical protein